MSTTASQRFKIASERVKIETRQLTIMSTNIKLNSETSEEISNEVLRVVCEVFGVNAEDARSRARYRAVTIARHAYCLLCSSLDSMTTLAGIGKTINRDHSTVIHSIKKCNDLRETDITFAAMFQECIYKLSESSENKKLNSFYRYNKKQLELQQSLDAVGIVREFMNIWDVQVLRDGFPKSNKGVVAAFNDLRVEATKKGF